MKLTTIILLATCLQVAAKARAQQITWSAKNVKLATVFKVIKAQTGYGVFYNPDLVDRLAPVTVKADKQPLTEFLTIVLKDQPLDFSIENKTIFIAEKAVKDKPKPQEQVEAPAVVQIVDPIVSGRVLNAEGQPLEGASVRVKGTKKGVSTDVGGRFSIEVAKGQVLLISYTGFEQREYTVGDDLSVNLVLKPSESKLDEVKVIAYGTNSLRTSTGNSTTIKGAVIERQPVSNPLQAIQGRVAGLFIQQGSGAPGATMNIRIQGTNSLRGGGEPFYLVDGVPYTSSLLNTSDKAISIWGEAPSLQNRKGYFTLAREGSGSPLAYINPSDIESIEVLKDADATAIYGSKAANGAILITTKKGKVGAISVTAGLTSGWEQMPKRIKLLNSQQYLEMRREAMVNSNASPGMFDYDLNGTWDTTRYTDWQEEFLGKSSSYMNTRVEISGGSVGLNYLVGLTYGDRRGMLSGNFSDRKIAAHFSLNSSSANQRFKFQFGANYMADNNRLPGVNITDLLLYLPPVSPALRNSDGSLNWALGTDGYSTWLNGTNPLAPLLNKFNVNTNNLISNLVVSYNLALGLDAKVSAGYTYMQMDQITTSPLAAFEPAIRPYLYRSSQFVFNNIKSYLVEPQITYRYLLGYGKVDFLLGASFQNSVRMGKGVDAQGQVSDNQLENLSAATTAIPLTDIYNVSKYNAAFARLSYNYSNKYLVNLNARRDGSSRFGPRNRFHNFGAVGAGWVLSEEKFLHLPSFISFLKLKMSYGTTGNDQIGDYSYMNLFQSTAYGVPYGGTGSLQVKELSNDELQWELTKKWNTGLDLGVFADRIVLGLNYAVNRSSNLLHTFTLPSTASYGSILRNFDAIIQNTSLEVSLDISVFRKKEFSWSLNANFTRGRNKLVSLPNQDKIQSVGIYGYEVGEPLGIFYAYHFRGVDPQTGEYVVENAHGDPITSNNLTTMPDESALKVLMNISRPYYGGLSNSIRYKGLQLELFVQYVKQKALRYYQSIGNPGAYVVNQPAMVLDRWQKPGDNTTVRKFTTSSNGDLLAQSDAAYENASYARLANTSLSWAMPTEWLKRVKVKSCQLSLQAQNLLTITKFSGLDPETGNSALQPFRTIILGVNLGL